MKKMTKKSTNSVLPAFVASPFTVDLQKKNKEAIQLFKKKWRWKKRAQK
ncbi:hypothetical protein [Shouchella lonarensis]|uniref:Uncharacterized protein n=1 Tax=Shouchella lonarensis TaxID=1464122 RepID=A0A1G6J4R1_9BACI|nr:hypothetical protein [Shouchella lonarensis]SDC13730.1 hypothetical protein SAMN05421737_105254 [Shouchella lonarensis]